MISRKESSKGFVFVAFGREFVQEAAASAKRISMFHDYPILLITDQAVADPTAAAAFDEIQIRNFKRQYSDKIFMGESPYEKTIFLDTDTVVQQKMDPLFDMLDHFDIALQFSEGGGHYRLAGVPDCFREPSAGIIAWKRSEVISRFFENWRHSYSQIQEEEGCIGAWDQRSLRKALYFNRDVRIAPLPTEWQFYTYRPNIVAGPVVMVHGRGLSDRTLDSINASDEFRTWLPKVGYVPHYPSASLSELCRFVVGMSAFVCRVGLRRMLAAIRVWPFPECKRPA
jgi:hypothetical protein